MSIKLATIVDKATAEKLYKKGGWNKKTCYYWVDNILQAGNKLCFSASTIYPAPTITELLEELPDQINDVGEIYQLSIHFIRGPKSKTCVYSVQYRRFSNNKPFTRLVGEKETFPYSLQQALAEMWIKLREEKII